ncbi:MAG: hypothetical protein U0838_08205 [Chloroflexota bacterium]
MESETPGQGAGPDQPESASPTTPEPAWTTPPPATPSAGTWNAAPQPAAPQPAQPAWGQPATQGQWGGAPQQPAPAAQPAPQWSAQQPQQPGWGQQPAPQPAPQQPAWNPAPQPQPAPQPGWGQQPPAQTQPQPQGQWGAPVAAAGYGAPPPQQPAPQQGWGAPGQPQPGWAGGPPPARTGSNGCLKACLIVGIILVVLFVLGIIGLMWAGSNIVGGLGVDSNGNLKDCGIVSSQQLQTVLGKDTEAHPLSGLANATIGVTLDKRVLPDAENCYILSGTNATSSADQTTGGYGRIAKYSGDASGTFNKELQNAKAGGYFATDVSGAGDQAFCTGWSDKYPATGALVRKGGDLIYVSLLIGADFNFDQASNENGVMYSQSACDQAVQIAKLALH